MPNSGSETALLAARYAADGYLVCADLVDCDLVAALREETLAIAAGERGPVLGTDIINPAGDADADTLLSRILAIHFPHKTSPLMRAMITHPPIVAVLEAIIGPDIKCMQSMLFVKNAGKPGQAWHQDEHYIPTRDRSLAGVWIALDDATIDNGCLWIHPGSHRDGILWPMKPHGDRRFDNGEEAHGFPDDAEGGVAVEVPAGAVVIFNGYTLHRSLDNRRPHGFRRALVNHYMSARSLLPWAFGIPPVPRADFRDFELVAGEDPYAWKGKYDLSFPFIRPEDAAQAAQLFGRLAGSS
jgi:phytanoyl-CoA hydroxylase